MKIKVLTGYGERTNTYYKSTFDIVDEMPIVGENYNNEIITKVESVTLDTEERKEEAFQYEYFFIETRDADKEVWNYNLAVPKEIVHPELKMYEELEKQNGAYEFDGVLYILTQSAYLSGDECAAMVIAPWHDGLDDDGCLPCYEMTWTITNPAAEDLEDCCEWDEPSDVALKGKFEAATGICR